MSVHSVFFYYPIPHPLPHHCPDLLPVICQLMFPVNILVELMSVFFFCFLSLVSSFFIMCCRPVWLRLLPLLLLLMMTLSPILLHAKPTTANIWSTTHDGLSLSPPFNLYPKSLTHLFNPSHSLLLAFSVFPCCHSCTFLFSVSTRFLLLAPCRVERAPCHLR